MKATILIDTFLSNLEMLNKYIVDKTLKVAKSNTFNFEVYKTFATKVSKYENHIGIIFTSYGIDTFLVTNKVKNVRAAFVIDEITAKLCIEHNNANIIIFPLCIISENYAIRLLDIILDSSFEGARHSKRVEMLNKL